MAPAEFSASWGKLVRFQMKPNYSALGISSMAMMAVSSASRVLGCITGCASAGKDLDPSLLLETTVRNGSDRENQPKKPPVPEDGWLRIENPASA
jgi:hypothetical protein